MSAMDGNGIFKGTLSILEKALDFRSRRHAAITSNIANIDTPGYKAFDAVMDDALRQSAGENGDMGMNRTDDNHFHGTESGADSRSARYVRIPGTVPKGDRNTVTLDRSMADLAENSLMYNATAQMVSKKLDGLKLVIQGGDK
jgi:flagellar basal-body rod protein FlgB